MGFTTWHFIPFQPWLLDMAAPTPDQYARVRYLYESLTPKPPVRQHRSPKSTSQSLPNFLFSVADLLPSLGAPSCR